jgi:rod shape-determining protein MreC
VLRRQKVLLVAVCFGAAVAFHQPLRRVVVRVFRFPLVVLQSALSIIVQLPRLPSLGQENQALREESASRQVELTMLREALRHERRVHELTLGWPEQPPVVASIIGLPIIATQHVALLDKGASAGVAPDSILLAPGGLVGRIVEAHASTSMALLLTDPDSRIACLIERSREAGLLIGTGERLCQMIYLDVEADVQLDDRVVTAGLGGPFPKGLAVGMVVKIKRDERNARAVVWVKPSVRLSQIEEVACVRPRL